MTAYEFNLVVHILELPSKLTGQLVSDTGSYIGCNVGRHDDGTLSGIPRKGQIAKVTPGRYESKLEANGGARVIILVE